MQQFQSQTYDREKLSLNIVRLKKSGESFEVVLSDPERAYKIREGDDTTDIFEVLKSPKIFKDVRKGEFASEPKMNELFGTIDSKDIAKIILREGEFHLTSDQINELIERKKNQIIDYIHMNAIDPKTRLPHPKTRIELAIKQAGVHIDMHKGVNSQIEIIIKKLQPILPLRFEEVKLNITVPARYAAKTYSMVKPKFQVFNDAWNNDGSVQFEIRTPAGNKQTVLNLINSLTHGEAKVEEVV